MALTPEDVVNKRFQPTKFREGYDQDEVDDFLDEVVVELRRLNQENEELRQRLVASDSRINELQRAAPQGSLAPAAAAARGRSRGTASRLAAGSRSRPVTPSTPTRWTRATPTTCSSSLAACTRSTCARASRSATRSSPRVTPPPLASSQEAEAQPACRSSTRLDQERQQLEHRIEELRNFEREYRAEAQGLHRGPASRPRLGQRADGSARCSPVRGPGAVRGAPGPVQRSCRLRGARCQAPAASPAEYSAAPADYAAPAELRSC